MLCWYLPINTEGFIKDADTSICLWMIEVITLVLKDCSFRENSETMSKALWDEKLDMIVFGKFYSHMLAVSRGTFTNIHCHIEHSTFYTMYQFTRSIRWTLEVQASHDTMAAH